MDIYSSHKDRSSIYLLIFACLLFVFSPLKGALIMSMRSILELPMKFDTIIVLSLYSLVFTLAAFEAFKRIKLDSVFVFLFLALSILISVLFQHTNITFSEFLMLTTSAIYYPVARSINDFGKLYKYLNFSALVIGVSTFLLFFIFNSFNQEEYSQQGAYIVLPATIISLNYLFEKFNFFHLINFIATFVMIILAGARGPLVCVIVFIAIKLFLSFRFLLKKQKVLILTIILVCIAMAIYWQSVLINLKSMAQETEYSTRVIDVILNETFFEESSRKDLRHYTIELINENPITGVGVFKDRELLSIKMNYGTENSVGWYPHNVFLEIVLQFGILIGAFIIIILLFLITKGIFVKKDKNTQSIFIILISLGIVPLLFSGSYLKSGAFFFLLGVLVNIFIANKKNKEYDKTISSMQ